MADTGPIKPVKTERDDRRDGAWHLAGPHTPAWSDHRCRGAFGDRVAWAGHDQGDQGAAVCVAIAAPGTKALGKDLTAGGGEDADGGCGAGGAPVACTGPAPAPRFTVAVAPVSAVMAPVSRG